MQDKHNAYVLDEGPIPRAVTRRDALRLLFGAGASALGIGAASLALGPASAFAVTTQEKLDEAQARYDEVEAELERIGEEYAELNRQHDETLAQIEALSNSIDAKQAEIDAKQAEIDEKQAQIEEKQRQIEEKEREIERKQTYLAARMSSSYKSGPQGMLDLLLSATSFEEFTSSIYYLDKITEADERMIAEIKQLKAELEQEKADLEVQKAELESLQAAQAAQLQEIAAKQAEVQDTLDGLDEEVQDLIAQRDAEILAAQEEARRVAAMQAASSSGGGYVVTQSEGFSGSQAAVINAASWTPSTGAGFCAAWVSNVFANAGIGGYRGNACDMYWWYCGSSDVSTIKPGMIIAVPTEPYSYAAILYGHVGIYIGNNTVRHCLSGVVMSQSLSSWISQFGVTSTPRWGWLGGVVLG